MLYVPRMMQTSVFRTNRTCTEYEQSRCAICCEDDTQEVSKHVADSASVLFTFSAYKGGSVNRNNAQQLSSCLIRHKQARDRTMNTVLRGTYTFINMYICMCATADSALGRTTQCALCSAAQTYTFENELFPTTAVQQRRQVAAVRLIDMLLPAVYWPQCSTLWHPRPRAWLQGPLVQWCCVAGGTAAGGRHFAWKVELEGV